MKMKNLIAKTRTDIGLSTTQLSYLLGVAQSTVVRMEKSEAEGTISLQTLARAAAAMGYELEYALVSKAKSKKKSSYHGLQRLQVPKDQRRESTVIATMQKEERRLNQKLTAAQRILRACELSDYQQKLCSKKR